jgi:prepilin-type N-terminal cleavage/methylation domain-containing protein
MSPSFNKDLSSSQREAAAGFTLPEVLVASALLVLLLSLVFMFLIPSIRVSLLCSTRVEIQQEALRSLDRLSGDLLSTVTAAISVSSTGADPERGPVYLGIMPIKSVDFSGHQIYEQKIIVYYWQGEGARLIRKEWTSSSPPSLPLVLDGKTPFKVSEADLAKIAGESSLRERILARDVKELRVTSGIPSSPSLSSPITILLKLSRKEATGKKAAEVFSYSRTITLRNEL